ncbi:MAG: Glycoside hydrolase, 38 vacuolar alpha mannosidase [Chrysothrix sp. TS-e1954]|nr:MAG: Glycoside hydrolase, 38 vacuolar alpha mannosidase [Chrysothrix sp. TS-e1954]
MGGEQARSSSDYPKLAAGPVGKQIHNIYKDRLQMFTSSGQYESQSLLSIMYEGRASGSPALKLSVWDAPNLSRPTFKEATASSNTYRPAKIGDSFGPSWSTHWFKVQMTVPADIKNKEHLELHWDASNEGMVWTKDGEPLQGLTGNGERPEWVIPKAMRDGKEHTFYIEMACNGMFGNAPGGDPNEPPSPDKYFMLQQAEIVAVNLEARALFIDFWLIGDAAREFPEDSWEEHEALQVCNKIMDVFIAENGDPKCLAACRKLATKYIGSKVDSAKIYDGDQEVLVQAVGNCHIDTCWLWPWAETKRKIARSWLNQCDLLERYPEHRFVASQAQQFKWLKMYYPSAYDRVKEKVKKGTFQPIGGSWVEHDTNMPSGESLVRQFLYGQRFFESHFGERSTTFWLPDTFGYSSQLPQLCRLAGMSRFFTQKLSWNNINNFPHTTFNWVALDGSQVICHMAPAETYTADAHFGDVKRSITQHKSMDQDATSLLMFGKGDGGGGPTWQMIEKLRRCRGISDNVGRLPRVKMGESVDDFFARLEKKAKDGTEFVTWYGELYFELHRGTYTTQANNKRNNRRAEILLHDIEYLATLASIKDTVMGGKSGYKYPKADLDDMWEAVLLCQFHDCLPGSCIEMCYDDSDELYQQVFHTGETLLNTALDTLGFQPANSGNGSLVAINTSPYPRSEIIKLPSLPNTPSFGLLSGSVGLSTIEPLKAATSSSVTVKETKSDVFELSNAHYSATITSGLITSLYDKRANRELVPEGKKGNQLVLYDDKPLYWQAWDVEVYHLHSRKPLHPTPGKTRILESGPHRASLEIFTPISSASSITTTVSMSAIPSSSSATTSPPQPALEFSWHATWHEDKSFLKVEFPTPFHSTSASFETQYGLITRPTHYNTSWDMAKFEVCAHRWADLSEATFGMSVLNDGKYGFAVQGSTMRLSLLRAPKAPDGHADMGHHWGRYAVLPHEGPVDAATVQAARTFNNPVAAPFPNGIGTGSHKADGRGVSSLFPYTSTPDLIRTHASAKELGKLLGAIHMAPSSAPSIVLDTIKRGEDDEDVSREVSGAGTVLPPRKGQSVIIRLCETVGGRCRGRVETGGLGVKRACRCNLLEDDEAECELRDGGFEVEVRAFEVVTFRLCL